MPTTTLTEEHAVTEPLDPTAVVLARLEVKLDNALARIGGHSDRLAAIEQELSAHSTEIAVLQAAALPTRVSGLERKLWLAAGFAAGVGGIGGGIVSRLLGA